MIIAPRPRGAYFSFGGAACLRICKFHVHTIYILIIKGPPFAREQQSHSQRIDHSVEYFIYSSSVIRMAANKSDTVKSKEPGALAKMYLRAYNLILVFG